MRHAAQNRRRSNRRSRHAMERFITTRVIDHNMQIINKQLNMEANREKLETGRFC